MKACFLDCEDLLPNPEPRFLVFDRQMPSLQQQIHSSHPARRIEGWKHLNTSFWCGLRRLIKQLTWITNKAWISRLTRETGRSELLKSGQKHNINSCQRRFTNPRFENKSCNSPILQRSRHAGVQSPSTRHGELTKDASMKSNGALLLFFLFFLQLLGCGRLSSSIPRLLKRANQNAANPNVNDNTEAWEVQMRFCFY